MPAPLESPTAPSPERRQWNKALADVWPEGDLSSLLFFERTLPFRRKQTLQAILQGGLALTRLRAVFAGTVALPSHAELTDEPMHRGLPVDVDADRVLLFTHDDATLCAWCDDDDTLEVLLLDGPLPFSDRRVRYQPRSELEGAEALAAEALPFDLRFMRSAASRLDDRFSCPPDLEAGWRLARLLDETFNRGAYAADIDGAYQACLAAEADLVARWTVRRELVALLLRAAAWTSEGGTLVLDDQRCEHDGDVLRLCSTVTGSSITVALDLLDEGALALTFAGWDGREHHLTVVGGAPSGPLPPLESLLDLAVELDDLETQLQRVS